MFRISIFSLILLTYFIFSAAAEPPAYGDPDEVWITTSSGDTIVVGEQIELQYHIANSVDIYAATLTIGLSSPDSAAWEWVIPEGFDEYLTTEPGSRFNDNYLLLGATFEIYVDTVELDWYGFPDDPTPPGPLEHFWSLHLRPTRAGTIIIDTACIRGCVYDNWMLEPIMEPSWAGPLQFTVVEPVKGDINCDGQANIEDAVYLINWIFRGGPPPCR